MQFQFNATQIKPQGDRSPLPAGDYDVILHGTKIEPGKNPQTDQQFVGTWKVTTGPLTGELFTKSFNVRHSNPVAAQIGQEQMSALCWVCGCPQITDTAQLHGRPHKLKLSVSSDNKYNDISAILGANGQSATDLAKAGGGVTGGPAAAAAPQGWQQPAPQPMAAPMPQPAPAAPAPAPAAQPAMQPPTPAPVEQGPKYYTCVNGQVDQTPRTAAEIRHMYPDPNVVQVCQVGANQWQPGTTLPGTPAAVSAPAPAGMPPWMTTPAPNA